MVVVIISSKFENSHHHHNTVRNLIQSSAAYAKKNRPLIMSPTPQIQPLASLISLATRVAPASIPPHPSINFFFETDQTTSPTSSMPSLYKSLFGAPASRASCTLFRVAWLRM